MSRVHWCLHVDAEIVAFPPIESGTAFMPTDHTPDFLPVGRKAGAITFGLIFAGESFLRALNVSVIPLQAYELLGSSQRVSILATVVSLSVLCTTLFLPLAFRKIRRRWAYSAGVALIIAAAMLFASYTVAGQVLGQYLRNVGAAVLNITLSLYIMDHIKKSDLARTEPVRFTLATVPWVLGPALGTWLYSQYGTLVTQLAVMAAGLMLLAGFWYARLNDPRNFEPGTLEKFRPLENIATFISQPRLRLAWTIAFSRSCFWSGMFIYGPLLMVEGGLATTTAGFVIAASQLALPVSMLYGRIARSKGVRPVVAFCFAATAIGCLIAGFFGKGNATAAVVFLLAASFCATGLDGVGGVPFLRAVKTRQRRAMASVYRSFFECAELIPGFVFSLVLLHFEIGAVFILLSAQMLFMSVLTWKYLPKSMK